MKKEWPDYAGTMNTRAMRTIARRAYGIWNSQCQRCNNPGVTSYKTYGARGIRVEYSARDFIGWWIWQYGIKSLENPGVGRIDHSKNYSFDNIEMVEHADNAREMYHRTGGNKTVEKKPIVLVDDEKCVTHVFSSVTGAAKFAGVTASLLCFRKRHPSPDVTKTTKLRMRVYDMEKFIGGKL